jgi:hypothetical protein
MNILLRIFYIDNSVRLKGRRIYYNYIKIRLVDDFEDSSCTVQC